MRIALVVLMAAVACVGSNPVYSRSCAPLVEEHLFHCVGGNCEHKVALETRPGWRPCSRYWVLMPTESVRRDWMESLLRLMGPPKADGDYRFVLQRQGGGKLTRFELILPKVLPEVDVSSGFDSLEPAVRSEVRDSLRDQGYGRMLALGDATGAVSLDEHVSERLREGRWSYWSDLAIALLLQAPLLLILLWFFLQSARVHYRILTGARFGTLVLSQILGIIAIAALGFLCAIVLMDEVELHLSALLVIFCFLLLCWQGLLVFAHWLWKCARRPAGR